MLSKEKIMEVLEAYDLTGSYRSAAQLCGVDHHTVRRYVKAREAGLDVTVRAAPARETVVDPFIDHVEGWVDRSKGTIRGNVVHEKLEALGYDGSERTTRRVVKRVKAVWRHKNHRSYRPWIPEPGLWFQWDYGDGPLVCGEKSVLFCGWLAWCRFRLVFPLRDKRLGTVIAALDRSFRRLGGAPTYALTDNEKTVTERHIAALPVRNPKIVSAAVYYGVTIATCVPFDPESKGGSEATVKIAKADLVPSDANLRDEYDSWEALEAACEAFMDKVNNRAHSVTRRRPVDMLAEEQARLHRIPDEPYTIAFGESRSVSWSSTIQFRGARYSVPHTLCDERVWVRLSGDELVIVHVGDDGPTEVARHRIVQAGDASIVDGHYPPRKDPTDRQPKATNPHEEAFLAIGVGAKTWLVEAAAVGARQIETTMAQAVELCAATDRKRVDEALGLAATAGRFSIDDLKSILTTTRSEPRRANPAHSLQNGTRAWSQLGQP
ncbi:MAG: IS21 family transposase [Candidatus Microthrix parvicella]